MTRPTVHDVAKAARVSLATVDRVLNKRSGVSAKSIRKVEEAVEFTGYVRDSIAANLSRRRIYRFVFLLPDTASAFVAALREAIARQQDHLREERIVMEVRTSRPFDAARQAEALAEIDASNADGVAVMANESPEVAEQIDRLCAAGVRVITLVADLPRSGRSIFVGVDNVMAGRTAAGIMGRFIGARPGRVLMLAGSLGARDHMERMMGFRAVMHDRFPALELSAVVEGLDDADRVEKAVRAARAEGPLVGLYATGAGQRGLIQALDAGRDAGPGPGSSAGPGPGSSAGSDADLPVTAVHELTELSRQGLRRGLIDLVIDQNPPREIERAIAILKDLSDNRPLAHGAGDINLNIFVRENV